MKKRNRKTAIALAFGAISVGMVTTAYAATAPERTGYDFDGWSDTDGNHLAQNRHVEVRKRQRVAEDNGKTSWSDADGSHVAKDSQLEVLKKQKITAHWKAHPYTIHFERGQIKGSTGSISGSTSDEPMTYDIAKVLNTNGFRQNGYTFQNWKGSDGKTYTDAQKVINLTAEKNGKVTMTAQWKANTNTKYTVQHFKQNIDGSYPGTPTQTDNLTGTTDTTVTPNVSSFAGFTAPSKSSVRIHGDGNANLRYNYTRNSYTAAFNGNSGANGASITKKFEEALGNLPGSSKTGYTFQGWFTAASGGSQVSKDTKMPLNGATYYAHWTPNPYTVEFQGNGATGGSTASKVMTYDREDTLTGNGFSRTGYTFDGWATSPGGGVAYGNGAKVKNLSTSGTTTLYAHWKVNSYTANFNGNGGSNGSPITKNYGAQLGTLPTPSRTGYTFDGWYTAQNGGTKISNTTTMPAGGATYYAHWKINRYTVTVNKGTGISSVTGGGTYDYGTKITVTGTAATGYHDPTSETFVVTGAVTKTISATPNRYKINYNANGGTNSMSSAYVNYDQNYTLTTCSFSRPGYTFKGWATSKSGGVVYANGATVKNVTSIKDGVISLYAVWQANSYTVTFNGNGGNGANKTVNCDAQLGTLPSSSRTGYTFDGWWTAQSGGTNISNTTTMPAGNTTYYAHWKANSYTITLNGCAGKISGSASKTMSATYGSGYSLPTPTFVIGTGSNKLTGTFLGWYTAATGGTKWNNTGTYSNAGNITLYAHWGGDVTDVIDFGSTWVIGVNKQLNWTDARAYARALGGDLAIINSKAKQEAVNAKVSTIGESWIGCTDEAHEGVWRWVDGTLLSSGYTNWAPGEPNDSGGNEDYGYIYNRTNFQWNDYSNAHTHSFLVEIRK